MITVYLAGPIGGLPAWQANQWRMDTISYLSGRKDMAFLNPCDVENDGNVDVVAWDKSAIRRSNFVLAYCPFSSTGTSMEIMYSYMCGVPVILVTDRNPLSRWYVAHAHVVFPSLEHAWSYLLSI